MKNPTTFIFLRHHLTDNPQSIFYGASPKYDLPLSKEGRSKTRQLGIDFANAGIIPAAIVVSPLLRAKNTGEELRLGLGIRLTPNLYLILRLDFIPCLPTRGYRIITFCAKIDSCLPINYHHF